MIIYHLIAAREKGYGETDNGYFLKRETAEKRLEAEHKRINRSRNDMKTTFNGYYKDDWYIEEIEVEEE